MWSASSPGTPMYSSILGPEIRTSRSSVNPRSPKNFIASSASSTTIVTWSKLETFAMRATVVRVAAPPEWGRGAQPLPRRWSARWGEHRPEGKTRRMETTELDLDTSHRRITDVTDLVARFCQGRGDGFVNVFVPHATAGLALMELGSGSESDLEELVERV